MISRIFDDIADNEPDGNSRWVRYGDAMKTIRLLKKALKFYAPNEKWQNREEEDITIYPIILDDEGEVARQALKKSK